MNHQFTQDFLANALATFLGVVAALWLDRRQHRRHEVSSTTKILTLLRAELEHDANKVDQWQSSSDRSRTTGPLVAYIKDEMWRAFSDGGELSWLRDLDMLASLSDSYFNIRAMRDLAEKHFNSIQFLAPGNSPAIGQEILILIGKQAIDTRNSISSTIRRIDTFIKPPAPSSSVA